MLYICDTYEHISQSAVFRRVSLALQPVFVYHFFLTKKKGKFKRERERGTNLMESVGLPYVEDFRGGNKIKQGPEIQTRKLARV